METQMKEKKEKKNKNKQEKPKKPKKVHPKKYICYNEGCMAEFPQWKLARDHMEEKHGTKDPKLKRSIIYLDAKGDPKAAPKGAPKMVPYHTKQQCDTIKMRETPKVLATASDAASAEGHRGNDLGQFGPNWVRTWGECAKFPHLLGEAAGYGTFEVKSRYAEPSSMDTLHDAPMYNHQGYGAQLSTRPAQTLMAPNQYGNNAKNVTMGNPQQSFLRPSAPVWEPQGRMFRD